MWQTKIISTHAPILEVYLKDKNYHSINFFKLLFEHENVLEKLPHAEMLNCLVMNR